MGVINELHMQASPANIIRLIVTPDCNLRCVYCHNEGFPQERGFKDILPLVDLKRVLFLLKSKGVVSVCLTGGEPLIYEKFDEVLEVVTEIYGGPATHISTNGILLDLHMDAMINVGIKRINISCDAIEEDVYTKITGINLLPKVINNIERAIAEGFFININCVLLKNLNINNNIESLLDFWLHKGINKLSFLRLCFSKDKVDQLKYDIDQFISLLDSIGLKSALVNNYNRPPSLCYKYGDLEISVRYYVPNKSTNPCCICTKINQCSEGLYHPRLGLNGILRACILREDICLNLKYSELLSNSLDEFLKMYDKIPSSWVPATYNQP